MASRQLPKEACSSRRMPIAAAMREAEQPLLGGLPLGVLPEQLGVVLAREATAARRSRCRRRPSPGRGRPRWRSRRCTGTGLVRDRCSGSARSARGRRPPAAPPAAQACRSGGSRTLVTLWRACGRAPHLNIEDLSAPRERSPTSIAGHQGGRRAPDIARLDAVALGLGQVDLDLELRLLDLEAARALDDAVDLRQAR